MGNKSLSGSADLIAKLKKNATLEDVKTLIKVNTAEMHKKAQINAPVDTGFLKASIVFLLADGGLTGEVSVKAEYAPYLEWGTRWIKGRYFMMTAYQTQKRQFLEDMKRLTR